MTPEQAISTVAYYADHLERAKNSIMPTGHQIGVSGEILEEFLPALREVLQLAGESDGA